MSFKTIFKEGKAEGRRRRALRSEKKGFKEKEVLLGGQQALLGQKVWEARIDTPSQAEVQEKLKAIDRQHQELMEKSERLAKQKQETEDTKKRLAEEFEAKARELAEQKKSIDARLAEQSTLLKGTQREADRIKTRLAAIPAERDHWTKKASDAAAAAADREIAAKKAEILVIEEKDLLAKSGSAEDDLRKQEDALAPVQAEVTALAKGIAENRAEQKKVDGELAGVLSGLAKELGESGSKLRQGEEARRTAWKELGTNLASEGFSHPAIAAELEALHRTEKEMDQITARQASLEAEKSGSGTSSYRKMVAIILAGIVLVAGLVVALILLL